VDAAGQFLVDLENLPDEAVLPVGGLRPLSQLRIRVLAEDPARTARRITRGWQDLIRRVARSPG
jgi:hypothetical protein